MINLPTCSDLLPYWALLTQIFHTQYCLLTANTFLLLFSPALRSIVRQSFFVPLIGELTENAMLKLFFVFYISVKVLKLLIFYPSALEPTTCKTHWVLRYRMKVFLLELRDLVPK